MPTQIPTTHPKFIYWFAFHNLESSSVRYRGYFPLEYFKKQHQIDSYFVFPKRSFSGILNLVRAYISALCFQKQDSVIVIQRIHENSLYAKLLKVLALVKGPRCIYDLDDADYLENDPKIIYHFSKNCGQISAGSEEIKNHLKTYNSNITHATSPVWDLQLSKKTKNEILHLGWIGDFGGDHQKALESEVFPVLKNIDIPMIFSLLGVKCKSDQRAVEDYFKDSNHIKLDIPLGIDWTLEKQIQKRITTLDVGLATLLDTELHRSKSGIKAKQYLNNGVPVISTDLPENNKYVKEGDNGFLFSNSEELKRAILKFHGMDSTEYRAFSQRAKQSIVDFNHEKYLSDISTMYLKMHKQPTPETTNSVV